MNSVNLNNAITKIKHDRKKITETAKNNIVKNSEIFNSNIDKIVKYLKKQKAIKECNTVIKLQKETLEIINEIKNAKIKSVKDCNQIVKLRNKYNYQIGRIKNIIKNSDIPEDLTNDYNSSLSALRKSLSSYIRIIKREKNIKLIQFSINLKKLTPEAEKRLLNSIRNEKKYNKNWFNSKAIKASEFENLEIFNSNINKIVKYLKKQKAIKECNTIAKSQKVISEIITEISNTEVKTAEDCDRVSKLRNRFNYQITKINKIFKNLDINEEIIEEYDLSLSLLRKSISNHLRISKKQNNITTKQLTDKNDNVQIMDGIIIPESYIVSIQKFDSIFGKSISNKEDVNEVVESQDLSDDSDIQLTTLDITQDTYETSTTNESSIEEITEEINEDESIETIESSVDDASLDEEDFPPFPNDLRSFLLLVKEELNKFKNPFSKKKINRKKSITAVALCLVMCFLTKSCNGSHIEIVYAQENENNPLKVSSIEDIDAEIIDNSLSSLISSSEVDLANSELNLPSTPNMPIAQKITPIKSQPVFQQTPTSIADMSHVVRERELLTKEQLENLLYNMCSLESNCSLYFETEEEALCYLYSRTTLTTEEKMFVIMARENLTWKQLDESCAIIVAEAGSNDVEARHVASVPLNRCQSTAWIHDFGNSLYGQLTGYDQFVVYQDGLYKPYLGRTDLPSYQAAVDVLYELRPINNFLSFRAASTHIEGKQFTDGGNIYFNELDFNQRVESDYMKIIEEELAADERHKFNPKLLKAAKLMLRKNPFK